MNYTLEALIASLFTWSITAVGASVVFLFKKTNKNVMDAMLGFAAGVMIASSFWSLLSPSLEMSEEIGMCPWLTALFGFIGGGIMIYLSDKAFVRFENKIFRNTQHNNRDKLKRCLMVIFSITLHNIPEGLAIGAAFGFLAYDPSDTSHANAFLLALGIGIQNFPEGTAVSMPLRREGLSRKKSFMLGQLSGIVEPISAVIGALLAVKIRLLLPFLLAFAAGSMIYVVVEELIPESQTNSNKDKMALFTLVGFSIMMVFDTALG